MHEDELKTINYEEDYEPMDDYEGEEDGTD